MATSASIDCTHTNLPMESTNISMVAKIAKTMSPAGAMWLKGALEQRLETELMPMFRDAMPND